MDRLVGRLQDFAHAQSRFQDLLDAVMAVGRELELPVVLRRVITTAMGLVDARYGALGVLSEDGEQLEEFIPVGLSEREVADLAGVALPHGRGLLKHLIDHPEPLRVADIGAHARSVGFPPGHPPMRTLLGVAVTSRSRVYGNLYLSERRDGQPFDVHDEDIVVALAGAAGLAIENARLYRQVRASAEYFQRLLLPQLPDLDPFETAAVYRPAATPDHVGGDWYDALMLPDGACALVIGDVGGHDLQAAATMAQTRNMLRALLYDRRTPPSAVLTQLDRTLDAITDNPITTACLVRIEPATTGWTLHWSNAGHPPPLLLSADGTARYLHADPGLPLGVDTDVPRPDHKHPIPGDATLVLFTDGLVEHPGRPLDAGLTELARVATAHAGLHLDDLCRILADAHIGDGRDDLAVLALRTPPHPHPPGAASAGAPGAG
ncbi:SpoIIE family protein phosphatase [Kitasatospora sp. NBC_00374]|uniref:PP2C family protein-serine/threonine phosphatase n=1 Tax=Kitasatospora sp. NBC_00374 TaxID=2975964 RepID=UPI0030E17BE0